MKQIFSQCCLIGLLCVSNHTPSFGAGYLLQSPPPFDMTKLNNPKDGFNMNFQASDQDKGSVWHLRFRYFQGKTYLLIQFQEQLPEGLSCQEKAKLTKSDQKGQSLWNFVYPAPSEKIYEELTKIGGTVQEEMGMMAAPLIIDNTLPKESSPAKLSSLLQNSHVVFYTGAGVSAGVVPTMGELFKNLNIQNESQEAFFQTIQRVLNNPKSSLTFMAQFNQSCLNGKPTPAHESIKSICLEKNWGLMTENIDKLHQRTGIDPLNHNKKKWLENNISLEDLRKIDVVITVGLHTDESGFLKWYKQHNPKGIIVSFNLVQPDYLSDQDFIVVGDIQETIPELQKLILNRREKK
ncbi:MAG: hypothetical protein HRU43_06930 [Simkaniaceae bacterium]|nr:hypothetical protein [Simkaniaceae bacterium]